MPVQSRTTHLFTFTTPRVPRLRLATFSMDGMLGSRRHIRFDDRSSFKSFTPCHRIALGPPYSLRKYASNAARSSGSGCRSKLTPSVDATGGTTPGGWFTFTRLKNSM